MKLAATGTVRRTWRSHWELPISGSGNSRGQHLRRAPWELMHPTRSFSTQIPPTLCLLCYMSFPIFLNTMLFCSGCNAEYGRNTERSHNQTRRKKSERQTGKSGTPKYGCRGPRSWTIWVRAITDPLKVSSSNICQFPSSAEHGWIGANVGHR